MNKIKILFILVFVCITLIPSFSQTFERKDIPEKYKWNLADIYPTVDAWQADVDMLNANVEMLAEFNGKLSESADALYKALKTGNDLTKTLWRAWVYAGNLSNENLNENQAIMQQMRTLETKLGEVTAFFEPEILKIPKEKIDKFFNEKP